MNDQNEMNNRQFCGCCGQRLRQRRHNRENGCGSGRRHGNLERIERIERRLEALEKQTAAE